MPQFRIVDAFPGKREALGFASTLRRLGVQFVRVRKIPGKLPYAVFVAGRNSSKF